MAKEKGLPLQMTLWERRIGIAYLGISLLALPVILSNLNGLLPQPMDSAWLNFIYFSVNLLAICIIFRDYLKRSLIFAGSHIGIVLQMCLVGFGLYWVCNMGLSKLILMWFPDYTNLNDQSIADMSEQHFLLMTAGTVFLVPLAEEVLHRGLIFGTLHRRNPALAYILSPVLFSLIHLTSYIGIYSGRDLLIAFLQYIPAGLILARSYARSGCIFVPVLIHTVVNAIGIYALR